MLPARRGRTPGRPASPQWTTIGRPALGDAHPGVPRSGQCCVLRDAQCASPTNCYGRLGETWGQVHCLIVIIFSGFLFSVDYTSAFKSVIMGAYDNSASGTNVNTSSGANIGINIVKLYYHHDRLGGTGFTFHALPGNVQTG